MCLAEVMIPVTATAEVETAKFWDPVYAIVPSFEAIAQLPSATQEWVVRNKVQHHIVNNGWSRAQVLGYTPEEWQAVVRDEIDRVLFPRS